MTSRSLFWHFTYLAFVGVGLTGAATYLSGREAAGGWVDAGTLAHVLGGLALLLPGFLLCWRWLHPPADCRGRATLRLAATAALAALATGLLLLLTAAAGHSIRRVDPAYHIHCAAGLAALALGAVPALRRGPRTSLAVASLAGSSLFLVGFTYLPERYFRVATATHPSQVNSELYPAGASVRRAGDWSQDTEACGSSECHPSEVRDWSASSHARGRSSGLYAAGLARMEPDSASRRFCQGCHAPTALLAGGSESSTRVTCLACHARVQVEAPVGNGLAAYSAPRPSRLLQSVLGAGLSVRLRPAPHRAETATSRDGPASGCVPCHRLSLTAGMNGYGIAHYDDTWRQWLLSPYAGLSVYSAREGLSARSCVDCHPPHKQPGEPRPQPYVVEVVALRYLEPGEGTVERIEGPLATRSPLLRPGAEMAVDVLVRTRGVGHSLPAGSPHLREMRLRLTVADLRGRLLLSSGFGTGARDGDHVYGLVALDRAGRRVVGPNLQRIAVALKQIGRDAPRLIPAEGGDVARYRFRVPSAPAGGGIRIRAVLERGELAEGSSVAFGVQHLPVRVVAEHAVDLRVAGAPRPYLGQQPNPPAEAESSRFLDYGLALLGQGDRQRARGVLRMAAAADPGRAEILVALGRTYLAEGDLLAARELFESAATKGRAGSSARAWLASTLRRMGQFREAVRLLEPLVRRWPHDAQLRFELGRCFYQLGDYEGAARAFEEMLAIDPVDSAGHYHLMLSNRRLRRTTASLREEAIYQALRDEPPPTALVEPYLRAHPQVRRELLPMHEHRLVSAEEP